MRERLAADAALAGAFSPDVIGADGLARIEGRQRAYLVTALGGPAVHPAVSIEAVHAGLGLSAQDIDLVVAHIVEAFADRGVPAATTSDIADALLRRGLSTALV